MKKNQNLDIEETELLNSYENEVKRVLADVYEHNRMVTKDDLKEYLIAIFCKEHNFKEARSDLNRFELQRIEKYLAEYRKIEGVVDLPQYESRGVCYFFLGDRNLLPFLGKNIGENAQRNTERNIKGEFVYA